MANVLIAAIHYPICSARYIARALRRMGHDVKTVGPYTGRDVWGLHLPEGNEWKPDYELPTQPYGGMSYPFTDGWKPELMITADSALAIHNFGWNDVKHILYGVDNHVRDYRLGVEYDHLFLAHSNGYRIGEPNVTWLPCAYDPEWHTITRPLDQRPYHAAMIGVVYEERAKIIEGIGQHLRVLAGTGIIMEDYRDAYNQALISVCRSIKGDLAQRVFETAAMGCIILSDRVPDMDKLGMVEGVHCVGYETAEEATAKALEIVNDWEPERVKAMIGASLEWVKPHTWDARCQTILEVMGL